MSVPSNIDVHSAIVNLIANPQGEGWRANAKIIARYTADRQDKSPAKILHRDERTLNQGAAPSEDLVSRKASFSSRPMTPMKIGHFDLTRRGKLIEIRSSNGEKEYVLILDKAGEPYGLGIKMTEELMNVPLFGIFFCLSRTYTLDLSGSGRKWESGISLHIYSTS